MATITVTFDDGTTETLDEDDLVGDDSFGYADPVTIAGTAFDYRFTGFMWGLLKHAEALYVGFSTSSNSITDTGSQNYTFTTRRPYFTNMWVRVEDAANSANYMEGILTSYTPSTGAAVFAPKVKGGSGTITSWKIYGVGMAGPMGANGLSIDYKFSTTVASGPASGYIQANNADLTLATVLYLNDNNSGGVDVSAIVALFDDSTDSPKGYLQIQDRYDPNRFIQYIVTALTDQASSTDLTVTYVAGTGAWVNNDPIRIGFTRNGNQGATGNIGDIPAQTEATDGQANDYAVIYDASAGATRKISLANLFGATSAIPELTVDFATFEQAGQHKAEIDTSVSGEVILADTGAPYRAYTITGDATLLVAGPTTPGYVSGGYRGVITQDGVGGRDVTILPANLIPSYSEQFDNAAWTKSSASISANAVAAPDGRTTADKVVEAAASAAHGVYQSVSKAASAITYTGSIFAKAAERTKIRLLLEGSGSGSASAEFDLSGGTATSASASGFTSASSSIQDVGSGWFRCILTATSNTDVGVFLTSYLMSGASSSYLGDGASGAYLWGAQIVAGSDPLGYAAVGATRAGMVVWPNGDEPDWAAQAAGVVTEISLLPAYDGNIHAYKIREA